ncbi:adenylate/guanylate cyclase domain-containing protein [Paenibacillus sp. GP183]|uniref:CHASE2 domain-containing protein n=1 Tax=Paenibacillus sp. GP183 TaxID=1882751 RepID=UPI000B8873E9|nr:adenylate/guanylate cyclase domain-containing protein [Paenibacillus sp. GP183]
MKKLSEKTMTLLVGNICLVLLCSLLFLSGALSTISNSLFDFNMKNGMSHAPAGDILLVTIDTESLQKLGPYPWDRKLYSDLIQKLEDGGAKAIAFDIELYTQSNNPASDALVSAISKKYNNIIFPSHADLEGTISRSTIVQKGKLIHTDKIVTPLADFKTVPAHINAVFDPDGVIRRTWLQIDTPQGVYSSFALKLAEMAGADIKPFLNAQPTGDRPKTETLIKYDAVQKDFENVSYHKVLEGTVPSKIFKDRIVLVGYTAPGSDQGITPIENHMNLVYAHANILNQILAGELITFTSDMWLFLIMILLALIAGYFTWRLKSSIWSVVLVFLIVIVLLVAQYYLYVNNTLIFDATYPLTAVILAYLVNIAIKTYFETKNKNFITKQFGRYISPELVKEIASNDREIELGGINKELSILFLDIRGFTTLSEKLQPAEVVDFLNTMFNLITEKALENHGTIDKFIGDAAMILFNAPLDVPNHEYYAVKTAYDIQRGMEDVRNRIKEKYNVVVSVGIGINTGEVVVGNIGSYLRVDYTAIGDNVNIAARIESNTTAHQILVSESTYDRTKEHFEYNFAGEKMMKGKTVALKLFEVTELKSPLSN